MPARWPADLAPLRTRLARGGAPVEPSVDAVKSAAPVLVLPLIWPRPGEGPPMDHGAVVLRLDREFLGKVLIPELVKSWFGRAEADLLVAVMAPDGPVYLSDPSLPVSRYLPGDVSVLLLGLRPMSEDLGRERHGHRRSPLPSAGRGSAAGGPVCPALAVPPPLARTAARPRQPMAPGGHPPRRLSRSRGRAGARATWR